MNTRFLLFSGMIGLSLAAFAGQAHAQGATVDVASQKAECIKHYESAQILRREGKLLDARESLTRCAASTCPAVLQSDCLAWLGEVNHGIPSIIVTAHSDRGDETEVRVLVDGQQVATHLDGKAIVLNVGRHDFRFERAPYAPVEKTVLMVEGEQNRILSVSLVVPKAPLSTAPQAPLQVSRPVPVLAYLMGGLSVAGIGAFAVLGVSAMSDKKALEKKCAPFCTSDDVQGIKTKRLIADISIGAAAAAATTALLSFVTRPARPAAKDKATALSLQSAQSGATINVAGEF